MENEQVETVENEFKVNPQFGRDRVSGIGGWLILPIIGLIITVFKLAFVLLGTFFPLLASGNWRVLTTPGSENYDPLWGPLLVFEGVGNLAFLTFAVVLLILLFSKSPALPKSYIIYLIANITFVAADILFCQQIPMVAEDGVEGLSELIPVIIGSCIWIPYFLKSERVKNTFVRR